MFNSTYYWKVRAIDNEEYSDWTDTRSFTTFEKLVLNIPINGSENKPVELLLKWKDKFAAGGDEISGFDYFQLQHLLMYRQCMQHLVNYSVYDYVSVQIHS